MNSVSFINSIFNCASEERSLTTFIVRSKIYRPLSVNPRQSIIVINITQFNMCYGYRKCSILNWKKRKEENDTLPPISRRVIGWKLMIPRLNCYRNVDNPPLHFISLSLLRTDAMLRNKKHIEGDTESRNMTARTRHISFPREKSNHSRE